MVKFSSTGSPVTILATDSSLRKQWPARRNRRCCITEEILGRSPYKSTFVTCCL